MAAFEIPAKSGRLSWGRASRTGLVKGGAPKNFRRGRGLPARVRGHSHEKRAAAWLEIFKASTRGVRERVLALGVSETVRG